MIETVEKKLTDVPEEQKRFFAIKLLEKDDKIQAQMKSVPDVSAEIKQLETVMDDDTESIITNERYTYISSIIKECYTKKEGQKLTTSDKIDKIVTNRWLALPIFAVVMFIVYYVSVTTVGTWATDWANDGVFGDGWHLFTIGTGAYEEAAEPYDDAMNVINAFVEADGDEALAAVIDSESEDYDPAAAVAAVQEFAAASMHPLPQSILWKMKRLWQPRMLLTPVLSWQRQLMYTQQTAEKLPIPQTTVSGYPAYLHC